MLRQWPLLLPLMSMVAGLVLSAQSVQTCSLLILAAVFTCIVLSICHKDRLLFSTCTVLFFFFWGLYALTPWLLPDNSPSSIRFSASDQPVTVEGIVASRPTVSPDGSRLVIKTEHLFYEKKIKPVHGTLMLYVSEGEVTLARGDRIRFRTRLSVPRRLGLPGEFNYPRYMAFQEISVLGRVASQKEVVLIRGGAEQSLQRSIDLFARRLGDAIRIALPDKSVSSILTALLIGDQKRIPQQLADAYTRAGVNHILSISGFHIGIIAAFITLTVLWMLTRFEYLTLKWNIRRAAVMLAVPSMLVYLLLTGNAPATARSVIMLAACALALYMEREKDSINTLLLAAFCLIAINPPTLFDVSFQLSFLSLWGIIIIVPAITRRFSTINEHRWLCNLIQFIAASMAASFVTLIPVLYAFNVASLNGILSNFLIVPLLGYGAILTGFCALPFLLIMPSLNQVMLWPAAKLVQISNVIIEYFAALPIIRFHGITSWDMFFFLLFMCCISFVHNRTKRLTLATVIPLVALVTHITDPTAADGQLHITMLSVGQAESVLLRLPGGSTVLVDGGGYLHETGKDFGQRLLAPALGSLGVRKIDWMISTHEHPDHIGGLAYVAKYFRVGEFWCVTDLASEDSRDIKTVLAKQDIPVRRVAAGDRMNLPDGVVVQIYSPPKKSQLRSRSEVVDENEESLVFRISYGNFSMLFAADAGFAAEQKMLSSGYDLKSTVLKVGHHGSKYSTSEEFIDRVHPRLAFISAGVGNRFGLPSTRTVELIKSKGIQLYRTDLDGTIVLISNGTDWRISTPYAPD